jgi:hypothetical protein
LEHLNEESATLFDLYRKSILKKGDYSHGFFLNYTMLYNSLFFKSKYDLLYYVKKKKKRKTRNTYRLILTFRNNKFFINLLDILKRNYLFISTGLFIKYFDKKKLYKKSKIIRAILIKFLRKLFLLMKFPRLILIVKKNPIFLLEFLNLFNQPIPYKFNEPLTNREIIDAEDNPSLTKIMYVVFLKTQSYIKFKTKKQGRVKRKISRKIVLKNAIVD